MLKYLPVLGVFFLQEVVGLIVFPIMSHYLGPKGIKAFDLRSICKGMLERLVLFTALIHGYPQILIAFAAMKLGTRLHEENHTEISNTFYLVGNFISILLAMISSIIIKAVWW